MSAPRANLAVVARRSEPADSLDYFPTPPWATRAFVEALLPELHDPRPERWRVREPACGEGHMAVALAETFAGVEASDIYPYGFGRVEDYVAPGVTRAPIEWVITNPPFNRAEAFLAQALEEATVGVALLTRTTWLHGVRRHALFAATPPAFVFLYAERVAMVKGAWDPAITTATDYAWTVWLRRPCVTTQLVWIAPGRREALTRRDDFDRFAARWTRPLLDGPAGREARG